MARGKLSEQTPIVPEDVFQAINDLYLYLRSLNKDVTVLETGPSNTFTTVDGKTVTVVNGHITSIV